VLEGFRNQSHRLGRSHIESAENRKKRETMDRASGYSLRPKFQHDEIFVVERSSKHQAQCSAEIDLREVESSRWKAKKERASSTATPGVSCLPSLNIDA
jgi:hypothetical protein